MELQVGRKGYDKGLVLKIDKDTRLDVVAAMVDKMKYNKLVRPLNYRFLTLTFAIHDDPDHKGNYSCSISL